MLSRFGVASTDWETEHGNREEAEGDVLREADEEQKAGCDKAAGKDRPQSEKVEGDSEEAR